MGMGYCNKNEWQGFSEIDPLDNSSKLVTGAILEYF